MSATNEEKKVLAAAKRFATAYIKYGKELDPEIEALVKAAENCWPKLKELDSE